MTDRNPGIIYGNIKTSPLVIDGSEACFDCCFICHVHDVRLDLRASGKEGDFSDFNGSLITVNKRNGRATCRSKPAPATPASLTTKTRSQPLIWQSAARD
jgi:hypothetical protein